MAIFPGGPGLAGTRMSPFWILSELRVMETTEAVRLVHFHCVNKKKQKKSSFSGHKTVKMLPPTKVQNNTQLFTGA